MKIAFYHELHKGGAVRAINELARQLKNRGHHIDLYTIEKTEAGEKAIYDNVFDFEFFPKTWQGGDWSARLYKDTAELFKLDRLNKFIANNINKKKYDLAFVSQSQFIETPFILKYLNLPKFYYLNDPYYRMVYESSLFNPIRKDIFRNIYEKSNKEVRKRIDINNLNNADFMIAASNFIGEEFKRIYKKDYSVIYGGVDSGFFSPAREKKEFDILFVGSRDFLDGYPLFQQSLKHIKTKIKIRKVLFENEWLSDKDLLKIYRSSKILIGTAFREPLGLVPLEAMSCGTPVVAINEGGHKETVVDKKTGFLVNKNSKDIASKVDLLLSDENLYKRLSKQARDNIVNNWSWDKRGDELEELLIKKLKK